MSEPRRGLGLYGALNAGVSAVPVDWQWMTYINDDDRIYPGMETALSLAITSGDAEVLYGEVDYLREDGSVIAPFPICRHPADVPALLANGIAPFTQQGALIRRSLWTRLEGFQEDYRLAADYDFWVRAARAGARFRYINEKVGGFRLRKGQLSGDVEQVAAEIEAIRNRHQLGSTWPVRLYALLRFRILNAPRIVLRFILTRRGRSRSLLARGT